jgi:hypothetical protein
VLYPYEFPKRADAPRDSAWDKGGRSWGWFAANLMNGLAGLNNQPVETDVGIKQEMRFVL